LILFFLRIARHGEAVAVCVVRWLSIDEEHVVMRAVARDLMDRYMPRVESAVARHWNLLPACEGADQFHRGRCFGFACGKAPAKYFCVGQDPRGSRFA